MNRSANNVVINGGFLSPLRDIVRTQMIPYQWDALNDRIPEIESSYCIRNFKIAAGLEKGSFGGKVFQDSDVYKWIEAASYTLSWHPDSELESHIDEAVDLIVAAQQPDGYINTYYTINGLENCWTNLMYNHELYCAGHLIEAAVACYKALGKRKLLDAAIRFADLIYDTFGAEDGKLHGYPGHEVIEMALAKLFEITGEERYLKLAKYFIDERGKEPNYFAKELSNGNHMSPWPNEIFRYEYQQAMTPVRRQIQAVGHAVRAVYLYSGMADVARLTKDKELEEVCFKLFENITQKQMYVTGAVGASAYGEAFTLDYDLPNDLIYGETCASVGLAFFAQRLLKIKPETVVADVLEKLLYNGTISGMALDGKSFFYVNPLEVVPRINNKIETFRHAKTRRQTWFACACCPPNLARFLASIEEYMYLVKDKDVYVNLFGENTAVLSGNEFEAKISQHTDYPWDGRVEIDAISEKGSYTLAIRIPGWCTNYSLSVNGDLLKKCVPDSDGYIRVFVTEEAYVHIILDMEMSPYLLRANSKVIADIGKAVLMRGPLVYCLEEADNGSSLHELSLKLSGSVTCESNSNTLYGVPLLKAQGYRTTSLLNGKLYITQDEYYHTITQNDVTLIFIPYYCWANRQEGEMCVWVHLSED